VAARPRSAACRDQAELGYHDCGILQEPFLLWLYEGEEFGDGDSR
jgi:hypothetical protein